MNCDAFRTALDDYLDGELPLTQTRAFESHADDCAQCNRALTMARQLQQRAFALPPEREPSRDLWPDIAVRLAPRRAAGNTQRTWLRAVAATVAVTAVFMGGMLAERVLREDDNVHDTQMADSRNETAARGLPSVDDARRLLPATHVKLIEGDIDPAISGMQSGTEQDLLRNLLLVNLAIRKVEAAVEDNPGNARLRELLSDLYTQEHRILGQAERLRVVQQTPTRTGI